MPLKITFGNRIIKHGKASPTAVNPELHLLPTDLSSLGLWEQAWEQVKKEEKDWELWPQFKGVKDLKTKHVVEELRKSAQQRCNKAENNQHHIFHTNHTYRETCSVVATWAKKFQLVGDLIVQAEPVYAALPWALVRFVIECAVSESDTWDSMLRGTQVVTTHFSKYPAIEQLYARIDSEMSKGLRVSLLQFFILMLKFQVHAIKYFDPDHKGRRTAEGMNPVSASSSKDELQKIQEAKDQVDADILLVDAEVTTLGVDNLKEGQKCQQEQLKAIKEGIKALSQDLNAGLSEVQRDQQKRHKDLIDMWKDPLDKLKKMAESERIKMEENYLSEVRTWISVANPWDNHKTVKDQRRMTLGKWLVNDPKFKTWKTSEKSSMLWLHGFAGTGKTGLVYRVIEDLRTNLKDQETGQESYRLAIFYCSNDKAKIGRNVIFSRADPEEALRSIVSQLSTTKEGRDVAPIVGEKYEAFGRGSDNYRTLDYSDCVEILIEISKLISIVIVLDAFDECNQDESSTLIKHLKELVRQSADHVKVFISTRSFSAIENDLIVSPSIEITAERNGDDVREFIETTLEGYIEDNALLKEILEPDLKKKIKDTLTDRAGNMILYPSLLLNQLCDRNHTNDAESIRKKFDKLPKTLTEIYNHTMVEIHDDKNNSQRSCRLAQDTFKWLLHAQEPLEYRSLLEAISPAERKADLEEVLRACRNLVTKEVDTIKFAHYSVREHIVQMEEYNPSQCNSIATRSCLKILNTFFEADETTRQRLSEPQKSFKNYALLYWPLHYEGIVQSDIAEHRITINAMLRSFLLKGYGNRDNYKEWFDNAQKMAEPLKDNKYLASKLNALRANPPTPLFAACVFGLDDLIAKFGRELNALNACNEHGQNVLCLAIENNKLEAVKALQSSRFPADLNLLNVKAVQQFEDWNPAEPPKVVLYASALQCAAATGRLEIAEFLIMKGAHVDLVAGYFGSPLQAACWGGHRAIVELLVREGAEPNSQGGYHGNALQAAAAGGHHGIIDVLLDNKPPALVGTPGGQYGSALMAAVCSSSKDSCDTVFALLEEKADPSVRNEVYGTPLEMAVSRGQESKDVIRILVGYKAKADLSPTGNKVHILHRAAIFGMNELVKYCLDEKCQIDMITTKGPDYNPKVRFNWFPLEMTPLGYACAEGHVAVVTTLLEYGAPFEEKRPYSAPLWAAAYQGHADVVELLITKFRAKHNEEDTISFMNHLPDPDAGQHFILFAAASSGNADVVKVLLDHHAPYRSNWFSSTPLVASATFGCTAVTKLLLDYRKDQGLNVLLNQKNQIGRTALFEACVRGHFDIASHLLDEGADLFIPNDQNLTTLHVSCHHEDNKFVEKLVNKASRNAEREQFLKFLNERHHPTGNTALIDCAVRNKLSSLGLLINHGADPLIRNNDNATALHCACHHNSFGLVELLVDKALETTDLTRFLQFVNQQHCSGKTALIDCAENNHLQALNLLLRKGANYTLSGHHGNTPLLWASQKGHCDVVAALVEHAKLEYKSPCPLEDFINHKNRDGINALFDAAKRNYQPIVKLLLDAGIDWRIANKAGVTALHAASWEGNTEVVSALLAKAHQTARPEDFKKFLDSYNNKGETALLNAAEKGRIEIVKKLIEYDADFLTMNNGKCSTLNLSCWEGHTDVVMFLLDIASARLSRDRFVAFLNQCNKWGKTVFADAAEKGRLRIIEVLRQYGADYRLADNHDVTPLHHSSFHGHKEVVTFLLKTAFENPTLKHSSRFLDLRNSWGRTALMDAAQNNRADVIGLLLDYKADYSICDNIDFTALHYCAFRNQMAAVRTLLEKTSQDRTDDGKKFKRFLNQQSKNNRATALRDAAIQKHTDVAKYILGYGPAYDTVDSMKRTALHHAVDRWDVGLAMELLKIAGGDADTERFRRFVNAKDENGATAWAGANKKGLEVLVERLRAISFVDRT